MGDAPTTPSSLSTVADQIVDGIEAMVPTVLSAVGAIIVACLVFWGVRALVRFGKSYFGK